LLGLEVFVLYGAVNAGELEASRIEGRTYISTKSGSG